jgi:hypothetical protein
VSSFFGEASFFCGDSFFGEASFLCTFLGDDDFFGGIIFAGGMVGLSDDSLA